MKRIIYCSRATRDLTSTDLVGLLETARRNNESRGLTGMLLYSSQSFLQVLDGEPAPLTDLFTAVAADQRHTRLRVLFDGEVATALFPDWSMGFRHVSNEEIADDIPGFVPDTEYPLVNPDLVMNASVATMLFQLYSRNRTP